MPTISFTLSAQDLTTAVDALGVRWGYQATLPGSGNNPESKGEFVRRKIGEWIRSEVRAHRLATAQADVTVSDVEIT